MFQFSVSFAVVVACCLLPTTNSGHTPSLFNCLMDCSERLSKCGRKCVTDGIEYGNGSARRLSICSDWDDSCQRLCMWAKSFDSWSVGDNVLHTPLTCIVQGWIHYGVFIVITTIIKKKIFHFHYYYNKI